jgi:phenolic acid decarboxylase
MDTSTLQQFDKDVRDVHLIYDYAAQDAAGNPEKWRYEMWFFSEKRIVYAIHGGPMAGRINYQTATYQCVRPGEIWQCNWLEGIYSHFSPHFTAIHFYPTKFGTIRQGP